VRRRRTPPRTCVAVWCFEFGVRGVRFRIEVWGLGFGFRVSGFGFRVQGRVGLGRVGLGFRWGFGCRGSGSPARGPDAHALPDLVSCFVFSLVFSVQFSVSCVVFSV